MSEDTASDPREWSLGRLLSTAARLVEHDWNVWLSGHDITHAGVLALHALDQGPLTQRQIAAASRVEEQTMSRVLDRLQRTGYVTRERDSRDRRRLVVTRTEAGDRIFHGITSSDVSDALVAERVRDPDQFRQELLRLIGRRQPVGEEAAESPP
jgi:DNA-binding MarR family transcriptional regulator